MFAVLPIDTPHGCCSRGVSSVRVHRVYLNHIKKSPDAQESPHRDQPRQDGHGGAATAAARLRHGDGALWGRRRCWSRRGVLQGLHRHLCVFYSSCYSSNVPNLTTFEYDTRLVPMALEDAANWATLVWSSAFCFCSWSMSGAVTLE